MIDTEEVLQVMPGFINYTDLEGKLTTLIGQAN